MCAVIFFRCRKYGNETIFCSLVIAVRVSGGHLCEAEAPTEPAGETQNGCGNPFLTPHVIAKPCKRLRQSVFPLRGITDLRMTNIQKLPQLICGSFIM